MIDGTLFGPVRAIPGPGVREECSVRAAAAEEDDLMLHRVVGHGCPVSRRRMMCWGLKGPVRPVPGPGVAIGVPTEEDDLLAVRVVRHGRVHPR